MLLEVLQAFLGALIGTIGFAYLLHTPKRAIVPAGFIGALAYLLYWLLLELGCIEVVSVFCGALFGALSAHFLAYRMKMISTIYILLSIVAAVPGLGLYRFMSKLGTGEMAAAASVGTQAMISILMIAMGIGLGGMLFRMLHRLYQQLRRT